jgi:ATP-dependent protease ClpP protease subunit
MADLYITGQIGTSYAEDGTIVEKGVELQDVVEMFEAVKNEPNVNIYINSTGGSVEVGNKIHDYLASFKNITTIATEKCMSIATKIHLSAPIENRKVVAGTEYLIHCPLIPQFSGNSDEFLNASKELKFYENDMVKMYVGKTTLSKEAVSLMMKQETTLTDAQVVSMGFASEIIPSYKYKAVAFFDTNKNKIMNKKTGFLASILAYYQGSQNDGRTVQALILETDKGNLETPFSDLKEGDPAMIDGAVAPAGTYTKTDGTVIEVGENGEITAITNKSPEVEELMVEMKAKDETIAELQAKLQEAETKATELTAKVTEVEAKVTEMENEQKEALEILASKQSAFKPKISNIVGKINKPAELSFKEQMEARKKEYKSTKK